MKWIESAGGPLILMPKSLLPQWGGASRETPLVGDDYGRACAVTDYLESLPVGAGTALVLGDSPDRTCAFESSLGMALLRWGCADSEELLLAAAKKSIATAEVLETLIYEVTEPELVLFDSVYSGIGAEEFLKLRLEPGEYTVTTRWYIGDGVELLAHVFERS